MPSFASTIRFFEISRRDVCYMKFILEAYDGLATMSTVDPRRAVVSVSVPPGRMEDADLLLRALCAETGMREIPPPDTAPNDEEPTEFSHARTA